ncbi:hypothetical protein MLD38_015009 [Melastoma candidum]|uniref:Uncharacterized protein n=1 Tax=Melastoma candidum TaxID=119954 RepID=A0ACB9REI3_9MYRT|nr:hypothetical protein MLD38_015009 [Melastoma candidum]
MVAMAATSTFFVAPVSDAVGKAAKHGNGVSNAVPIKTTSRSTRLQVMAHAQAPPKINGNSVNLTKIPESAKNEDCVQSPPPRTFINQLPDWSVLLAAMTTVFLAAEKQWTMLDWKPKRPDMLSDPFGWGRIVQDGLVFRQNFSIRSYEIGADQTASIETLMNHLQETALNHARNAGLFADGFGCTQEMSKKNLIWVVTKMQILVDRYPSWGDSIQVDTWVSGSGRNGMRRDWHVRDLKTGEIMAKASSTWVMMNKHTRRLSKMPEEVRGEIEPHFVDSAPAVAEDNQKLPKLDDSTADFVRSNLTPRWHDLDVNQHVNNVKYLGWILESAPQKILESHELTAITLEYRKECGKDCVLQSLTALSGDAAADGSDKVECQHMLRLEDGSEILRARTEWMSKNTN